MFNALLISIPVFIFGGLLFMGIADVIYCYRNPPE